MTRSSAVTTSGLISTIAGIEVAKRAVGAQNGRHGATHLLDVQSESERDLARLERLQAHRRFDDDLQDGVGRGSGDLLDLHAALAPRR